ncbi:MAG: bifunctional diaminohydroxyphosphoribosylaminopyrimidine deaminase/5-amino-6-(5-phosphoribosylamino)uracil reductase RibD [Ectothiorhodospiraceae bacterium AqS1]|nr:bifunctional diaminohydroxyphosphoribosylaminopyrimidine deaminase/5-amino-6-(5-phosphoribosylamino)uracil reductase RibD [Ectothiorhodospiraceae bacterium AqS1]
MRLALDLARRGLWSTDPNPRVGCVIAKGDRIVGQGWHRFAGEPHAEIHALEDAGIEARGGCAYITLEPCCHRGRTGPCTEALIDAGVVRVVAAIGDPDPVVGGAGFAALESAGIEVRRGLLEDEARALNRGFFSRHQRGRPWLRCKIAATLDGRIATASGESRWITSKPARIDVHRLRARSGAILSGIGTVLADDPRLDVRIPRQALDDEERLRSDRLVPAQAGEIDDGVPIAWPSKVVVDSTLRTPPTARLLTTPGAVTIAASEAIEGDASYRARYEALREAGAGVLFVPPAGGEGGGLSLARLMHRLARGGVNELHSECGPKLAGALIDAGLVDELVIYLAPSLLGDEAKGMFALSGILSMSDRVALSIQGLREIGSDIRIDAAIVLA